MKLHRKSATAANSRYCYICWNKQINMKTMKNKKDGKKGKCHKNKERKRKEKNISLY